MRRELLWALGGSALLSLWALKNPAPKEAAHVVAPSKPVDGKLADAAPSNGTSTPVASLTPHQAERDRAVAVAASSLASTLPETWPQPRMEPATRSPFSMPTPPQPKPVIAPPPVSPQPPPPPTVSYRYWGSLTTPTGDRMVYVVRNTDNPQPTPVGPGTRLDGGWQVEQIEAGSIVLVQPGTPTKVTLPISAPTTGGMH